MNRPVLDACCGGRTFWFNPDDTRAVFMDVRKGEWKKDFGTPGTKGRRPLVVRPDVVADFTAMPFPENSFHLVVFDPPHHTSKRMGNGYGILRNTYGMLLPGWPEMLRGGFEECFRVLKPGGTLIFKWCSKEIPLRKVLELSPIKPLFGHISGRRMNTHWVAFIKLPVII